MFAEALPAKADFLEAGRVIQGLEAVITVDTAMAHQAGAQGVLSWVLLPWSADPRWLRDRSDTPWYPTLHLLRQAEDRSWPPVIKQLLEQLRTIPPMERLGWD
jgi:ADP-heptose:LPS heptosyltransferase